MPVIVNQVLDAPVKLVWESITNPEHMKKWYFAGMPDFKPVVGFTTSFVMNSENGNIFTATWQVTEVIRGEKITYNWSYKEYNGMGSVSFILTPEKDKTLVTLINEGLENFPQDVPEFTEESCRAGWEFFIKMRLPQYLENKRNIL